MSKKIAIFASGGGSNMEAIMQYTKVEEKECGVEVAVVISNKEDAYVLERAKQWNVPAHYLTSDELSSPQFLLPLLESYNVDAIILAGYLKLIPPFLLRAYPYNIINIHPALLPKYGGKGMHGMNVHKAVWQAQEPESGITIHVIDEEYDKGKVILQATTPLLPTDSPEDIAQKVLKLEHYYFPRTIVKWLLNK